MTAPDSGRIGQSVEVVQADCRPVHEVNLGDLTMTCVSMPSVTDQKQLVDFGTYQLLFLRPMDTRDAWQYREELFAVISTRPISAWDLLCMDEASAREWLRLADQKRHDPGHAFIGVTETERSSVVLRSSDLDAGRLSADVWAEGVGHLVVEVKGKALRHDLDEISCSLSHITRRPGSEGGP